MARSLTVAFLVVLLVLSFYVSMYVLELDFLFYVLAVSLVGGLLFGFLLVRRTMMGFKEGREDVQ